jgi:hypothetical protein
VPSAIEEEGDILLPTFNIAFIGFNDIVLADPPENLVGDNDVPDDTSSHETEPAHEARYCTVCNLEQPIRAKHCKTCNHCIHLYDHHCPWLGNCVGQRNRRWFYLFLLCEEIKHGLGIWILVSEFEDSSDT